MDKAFKKWRAVCASGVMVLIFTVFSFLREDYTWVAGGLLVSIFLISASIKRIKFLSHADKSLKAGKKEIIIFYRDRNLKESENSVIPAGADTFWFYGFLLEKKSLKAFRWERIRRAVDNGKDMKKDDILAYLK